MPSASAQTPSQPPPPPPHAQHKAHHLLYDSRAPAETCCRCYALAATRKVAGANGRQLVHATHRTENPDPIRTCFVGILEQGWQLQLRVYVLCMLSFSNTSNACRLVTVQPSVGRGQSTGQIDSQFRSVRPMQHPGNTSHRYRKGSPGWYQTRNGPKSAAVSAGVGISLLYTCIQTEWLISIASMS